MIIKIISANNLIKLCIIVAYLFLIDCKGKKQEFLDNHKVILYHTKEVEDFINTAKIKPKEAKIIQANFAIKNNEKPEMYNFFIIDGNYIFTSYFQPKIPEASINGIWVNATTGSARRVNPEISLKAYKPYLENGEFYPF